MKTEELNEYIFTDLVMTVATSVREKRLAKGSSDEDPEIQEEDLRRSIEILKWRRAQISSILKEFEKASPE